MTDFLLELRSEEIPARMQVKAREDLARLFGEEIAKAGLIAQSIETFATPCRLAIIARGLPLATEAVSEERKGPRANAPEAALAGFLRSTGLTREQLVERDGVFFATIEKPGRATAHVLAEAIPAIVHAFPWPKSMRWGAASHSTESLRWVRPLQGIVALLGEEIVPCTVDGIESGAVTMGHRFHHSGPITIGSADDYVEKLRARHVIVQFPERCALIRDGAAQVAADAGLSVIPDEGLVVENAGLTEWPVPLLGRFDPAFLDVPREVIQLTMRTNQKYFALADADGKLAPAFICTANIDASDGGAAIVAGNEKVLAARLSDAKFFWEADLKVPLDEQAKKLSQIVFHEKLGTVADKVERVAKLARWLCEEGIIHPSPPAGEGDSPTASGVRGQAGADLSTVDPSPRSAVAESPSPARGEELATLAERAARLCKADLVTGMVGEFPELQGIMGGYYAAAQGEHPAVAAAIRDHYKPVGQGDDVPTDPVTVAISLADKLDTLVGFFGIDERPTGSKDPYALRRSTIAIITSFIVAELRCSLESVLRAASSNLGPAVEDRVYVFGATDSVKRAQFEREVMAPFRAVDAAHPGAVDWEHSPSIPAQAVFGGIVSFKVSDVSSAILDFLADRLKVQQREAGVRHDLIDAVFALGGEDDLVRLLARVKALQAFVTTEEGANLLSGYKRAANILKKEGLSSQQDSRHPELVSGSTPPDAKPPQTEEWMLKQVQHDAGAGGGAPTHKTLSYAPEIAETALIDALDAAEPLASAAIEAEDFEAAMRALASLRAPIDAFFESVTVNDADPAKRSARLALLVRVRDAVHRVADFSKIEG